MATKRKPALTKNQQEFKRALSHIRRLGYTTPEAPTRITSKSLKSIHEAEQKAEQSHRAYINALRRQKYYSKKGIETPSLKIEKGKSAEEYKVYTGTYFRAYAEEHAKQRHPEHIQPYENKYQSTIDIIIEIDREISNMTGMTAWSKRYTALADRKSRIISTVKDYWTDIVDISDHEELVKLAARIEGKAETLKELITKRIFDSKSSEMVDAGVLSQILEILTGAKLSKFDQAIINDELDSGMYDWYD